MAAFVELSVCLGRYRWEKRLLNFDYCIRVSEHDGTEQFKKRPVQQPFASQPLFCLLTMVYADGSTERLWVHSSAHSIVCQLGNAQLGREFVPPVDMDGIQRSWERVHKSESKQLFFTD